LSPASTAGLLAGSACDRVGPPFDARALSWGSVFWRSLGCVKAHVPSLAMLLPSEVTGDVAQSPPTLFDTTEFLTFTVEVSLFTPPPEFAAALLKATVVFVSDEVPKPTSIPPPVEPAVFPLNVLFTIVASA
jgi:hypothetical protein